MRTIDPAVAAHRAARISTHVEILVWVTARNRSSGAAESMGLWTGDDTEIFTLGGQSRTYFGMGNVLDVPDFEAGVGLEVRSYSIGLSAISPEVETLLRGYDVRQAPVQVHRAEYNANGGLLAEPERIFKGWVDGNPIVTPAIGGSAVASLNVVSNARMLTRYAATTKSDEVHRRRSGDRFRRYGSIAGEVEIVWGGVKVGGSSGGGGGRTISDPRQRFFPT